MRINIISIFLLVTLSVMSQQTFAQLGNGKTKADFERVAIMVYAQNKKAKRFIRTARSRIESILLDNGIVILDKNKANKLKNVWNNLEDPGHFITAEEFVENVGKYEVDGVLRVYLTADSSPAVGNYHSATAQVDIRFVDNEANVASFTTPSMGSPGNPPSDGLTKVAALVNAVQRAVDKASTEVGLEVIDVANPRLLKYKLDGPFNISSPNPKLFKRNNFISSNAIQFAKLKNSDWVSEKVTCNASAPGNSFAAIGGYVFKKSFGRFKYWSNLHLVNLKAEEETLTFGPLSKNNSQRGTSKIIDCMFIYNWRFLAALTEHKLYVWDTERNILLTSSALPSHTPNARLNYFKQNKDDYIVIINGSGNNLAFKMTKD